MRRIRFFPLIAAATITAVIGAASPASASTIISVNNSGMNTTAADFPTHKCLENQGGGPFAGQDVWVFVLPGNHDQSGDFISLTAHFSGHPDVTITALGNPGSFSNGGPDTSKAWIVTPAGWTITGAEAEVSGTLNPDTDFFTLSHTCPSSGEPSESPSPQPSGSPKPSGSPTPGASGSTDPGSNAPSNPPLPRTGTAIMSIVFSGLVAIAGGAALLLVVRRRRDALTNASDE
jgi:LPXTG-motif cell wall-anchored protein